MKSLVACFVIGAAAVVSAEAGHSSFQRSCTDIVIEAVHEGAYLTATCGDGKGKQVRSQLELFAIANIDGTLTRQASGPSTFQRSCSNITVNANDKRATLVADCKRRDQTVIRSKLEIEDVENIFGELRYR